MKGRGRPWSVGDVSTKWLEQHIGPDADLDKPLWSYHPYVFESLRAGSRSVVLSVPIQRDGVAEGRESLTLKVRENGKVFTRTIVVKPSK